MDVLIVGGGMAGLSCARELDRNGADWALLESSDRLGGRVKTDELDGFRLDHGFQVLLTAYPALRGWIDLDELQLSRFLPGAQIRHSGQFHRLADPLRAPRHLLATLRAPMATLRDRWLVARLSSYVWRASLDELWASPETSTAEWLRAFGFSQRMIDGFFRPFFGGIFLERELATSSRQFLFVYKMFAQGEAALPQRGMQAIPEQLAASLDPDRIEVGAPVQDVDENGRIQLADGRTRDAQAVVVATDQPTAARLLGEAPPCESQATTCFYFALEALPVDGRWLLLDADGTGPINNLCFPSAIAPSYAPANRHLASVTVLGRSANRLNEVRTQLAAWFGPPATNWAHLGTYEVEHALPVVQDIGAGSRFTRYSDAIYVCGDHQAMPSLNGAIESGRAAAQAIRTRSP